MNPRGFSHSKLFRILVVLFVLFGLASWNPTPLGAFLRGSFHTVFLPFESLLSTISYSFSDMRDFLTSVGDMKRDNERLAEENVRLLAENAGLLSMRDENETLRKSIGLEARGRFDLLASEVIASGGGNERGSVVINRGSMHGVRNGMLVIVGEGVLVGIVEETYPASARVALVTDSDSALGGITLGNGTQGVVRGDRNLGISYVNVLQSAPLAQGDRIVTSGVGGTVPSGLLIGTVNSVRDSGDRLFREASVLSPVDFGKLRFLFLIR
jgi:rod shape-determining protein MreC